MKVLCAWCEKDGKPALMGEREPLDDPTETHGLCPEHRLQVEAEFARGKAEAERQRIEAERQRVEAERRREEAEALRKKVDP